VSPQRPANVIVGRHAVLNPRQCAAIAPALRESLRRAVNPAPSTVQIVSQIELLGRRGSTEPECGCGAEESRHALTTNAAARQLGISTRAVRLAVERGALEACWHKRSWRLSLTAVLEYDAQRRR